LVIALIATFLLITATEAGEDKDVVLTGQTFEKPLFKLSIENH